MKMRKLLAGAVAASVAVTSLATIASAETKAFNMGIPSAIDGGSRTTTYGSVIGETVGSSASQTKMQLVTLAYNTWDGANEIWMGIGNSAELNVKGYKLTEIGGESQVSAVNKTYKLLYGNADNVKKYGAIVKDKMFIVVLPDDVTSYQDGEFAPSFFTTIEEMSVKISADWACGTSNKNTYSAMKGKDLILGVGDITVSDWDAKTKTASNTLTYIANETTNQGYVANAMAAEDGAAALIGYALTNGGYKPSTDEYANQITYGTINWSVKYDYPELFKTDADNNNILMRQEIEVLSSAHADNATNVDNNKDKDQTYDSEHEGTDPYQFAGLATQVAEFFNKQTNGTITFNFVAPDAAGTTTNDWIVGGVPSTQVGVRNDFSSSWTDGDFALYLNYMQTGALEALASVDAASGSVTFDISEILDTLGGQTLGVIDNIYYGLTANAVKDLKDNKLLVKEIVLAYEEDADVEADIEEDDDAEIEDDATVEEDDDVVEDDAEIEDDTADDDDAEDDAIVDGDVIDTPVVEDDDANPGTGVALAVVPAMVAAAAVVLSKKRK